MPDGGAAPAPPRVLPAEPGSRLDVFLSSRLGLARAQVQRLVRQGLVSVDDRPAMRSAQLLRPGELVRVEPAPVAAAPTEPLLEPRLVYQDDWLAVVDKPPGLVVHPGPGHRDGTLAQQLLGWEGGWSRAGGADRPGIVHRLDRGTSGLLVLARTEAAHLELSRQLRSRAMGREYWALVEGEFHEARGRIEAALARDPRNPRRMAVVAGGREAITEFTVLERLPGDTALWLRLLTGRTHQIRAHLAYIGRPLVGDPRYGASSGAGARRPALHAAVLHLRHPGDGRELTFRSPLPADLVELRLSRGAPAGSSPVWPPEHVI